MGAFTGLNYAFRTGAQGDGRGLIMYCAHEEDYERYRDDIMGDIYSVDPDVLFAVHGDCDFAAYSEEDIRELEGILSEISMFVFVITEKFLETDNIARRVEFDYAVKNRMPIMPILPETGLEMKFNEICGNLQVLNRSSADPTAIPYSEKIEKMLKAAIAGEELADSVKQSFKKNLFISYRKKDRRYINEVRNVIHADPRLWSTGIWYDEFLTPGENFNESITQAFRASECFVLLITPSLLEEGNYVMTVEYPLAIESGVKIVAVETVKTDRELLKKYYPGLPKIWPLSDEDGIRGAIDEDLKPRNFLASRLHRHAEEVTVPDPESSPEELPSFLAIKTGEELYLLGAAYLYGINCEKNFDRALCLLTAAYIKRYPKAADMLESVYAEGIGTEVDVYTQNSWCTRLFSMVTDRANRDNPDFEDYTDFNRILDIWHRMIASDMAADAYEEALEVLQSLIWRIIPETEGVDMTPFRPHMENTMQKKTAYSVAEYQVLPLNFPWTEFVEAAPKFMEDDVIDILSELLRYGEILQLCGLYCDAWGNISDHVKDVVETIEITQESQRDSLLRRCDRLEAEQLYRTKQYRYLKYCALEMFDKLNERIEGHEEERETLTVEYYDVLLCYIFSELDRAGANEECMNEIDEVISFWKDRYEATHRPYFLKKQIESTTLKFAAFGNLDRAYAETVDENDMLNSIITISIEQIELAREYAEKFHSEEAFSLYAEALNNYVSMMLKVAKAYDVKNTENMEEAAELAVSMARPLNSKTGITAAIQFTDYCTALLNYAKVLCLKDEKQKAAEYCRELLTAVEGRRKWYIELRARLCGGTEKGSEIYESDWTAIHIASVEAADVLMEILVDIGDFDDMREQAYHTRGLLEQLEKSEDGVCNRELIESFIYPFTRYSWIAFFAQEFNDTTEFAYRALRQHMKLYAMSQSETDVSEKFRTDEEEEIETLAQILIPDEMVEMMDIGDDPGRFATQEHMDEALGRARKNARKILEDFMAKA